MHLSYARLLEENGNPAEARKSYQFVLDERPQSVDAILGLARLDQLAGRQREAEQRYQKALKLKPNDPHTLDAVGQYYASHERWDEALELLNSAMLAAPDEPIYRYHLAIALARSGDIAGAMPHFSRTVGDAQAHYNVGYVLYEQGRLDEAEQQFLQAAIKKPDLREAQQMLDDVRRKREDELLLTSLPRSGTISALPNSPPQIDPAYSPGPEAFVHPSEQRPQAGISPPLQAVSVPHPSTARPQPDAPSQVPAGMTAQQIEQWRNQLHSHREGGK